jgi:tetratricopeptide (TPR) repeat protein
MRVFHAGARRRLSFNRRGALVFAAVLSFSTAACQRDPVQQSFLHMERGDRDLQEKKLPEAILEYKLAVSFLDNSPIAHYKLAEAYVKNEELLKAFPEYLKAADLAPERDDIQVKAGNLLLVAGRFPEARNRARAVLQRNPKNVPAIILLGHAVVGLKDFNSAAIQGRKAVELDPTRPGAYTNLAALELLQGNAESAERAFKRAIELDPKSINARLSLANLYRSTGAPEKAEQVIKEALGIDANSPQANRAMASLYAEWNRAAEAEPYLKTAAEHSTDINATLELADYYLAIGRPADSKVILEKVIAVSPPAFVPATTRLAVIEYGEGQKTKGHTLLEKALAKEPRNAIALSMKARMLLSDNKVDEALDAANAAVTADPRSPEAQLILGRVHLTREERDDARKAFNEALKLGPAGIEAELELARLHLGRGEIDTAIGYAQQGVKASPNNLEAQLLLVQSMASRSDDRGEAAAALGQVITRFPRAPQVYNMAGSLALKRNDSKLAKKAWDRALELDPNNADALGGIASLYAADNKKAEAWALVEGRLKAAPNDPGLLLLGAKIRIINKDTKGAEELLKRSLASDASSLEAYSLLGWIFVSEHRIDEAIAQFTEMLHQQPTSVGVHTMMGVLLEAKKDSPGAIAWYRKALQLNPRAAVAANNLAWIYVTQNTEVDAALRLAEIARGEMPNQAEFHDTLGWVYYKKQLTTNAIETLQRAVQLDSKNPMHHYHLGMAYVQEGTDPKARHELEEALKISAKFDGAETARQTLTSLVY